MGHINIFFYFLNYVYRSRELDETNANDGGADTNVHSFTWEGILILITEKDGAHSTQPTAVPRNIYI